MSYITNTSNSQNIDSILEVTVCFKSIFCIHPSGVMIAIEQIHNRGDWVENQQQWHARWQLNVVGVIWAFLFQHTPALIKVGLMEILILSCSWQFQSPLVSFSLLIFVNKCESRGWGLNYCTSMVGSCPKSFLFATQMRPYPSWVFLMAAPIASFLSCVSSSKDSCNKLDY